MIKRLLFLLPAIFLIGCGSPIDSGYITNKIYEPERRWTTQEPVHGQRCESRSRTGYDGKPTYVTECESYVMYYRIVQHYDDPDWRFDLKECKVKDDREKCQEGWVYVDEKTYSSYEVGYHYPDPR